MPNATTLERQTQAVDGIRQSQRRVEGHSIRAEACPGQRC